MEEYLPHQLRVLDEKTEIDEKIVKLVQFIFSGNTGAYKSLGPDDKEDLNQQLHLMMALSNVLSQRIERF